MCNELTLLHSAHTETISVTILILFFVSQNLRKILNGRNVLFIARIFGTLFNRYIRFSLRRWNCILVWILIYCYSIHSYIHAISTYKNIFMCLKKKKKEKKEIKMNDKSKVALMLTHLTLIQVVKPVRLVSLIIPKGKKININK